MEESPSFKLSDAQYDALVEEFKKDKEVRTQADKIFPKKNKEKKKAEPKRDYTASDLCLKLGLTTHELREKIEMGELPQPDCGNKWSAKLLKDKDIILFF